MPEEAFDFSANDNDDITSLTRSVPGQFDEPDLMLDRVSSRVGCGDRATSLHSDEWQDSRIKQKDFMAKMSIFRKNDARLRICLRPQHSWPPDDRIFFFALFMVSSNLNLFT
jgi:hypothetical protein